RSHGLKPLVGSPGWRAKYPGQILGCDFDCVRSVAGDVDGFLYVGTGRFHPLGISLSTNKQVVAINPIVKRSGRFDIDLKDFLRRRKAMIARATACERFGVVVSTKPGQARFKLASTLLCGLRRAGFSAYLLVVDEVRPESLADFELDAFVCVACPRIPIDDAERFEEPVLTPFEAMVMLGETSFEPYKLDEVRREDFERHDEKKAA
ncbi:MAG: 2-(3-amino-3-carboxypropyl)histidine synthase subunit, partial [Hadesarchaea archaeon]|nr:2-(3-amino-3-carboxypropyl)histidine synthase subunit [Hadesarchaea archaeon]